MSQFLQQARYVVSENLLTCVAFLLFVGIMGGALCGPWLAPYDPLASDTAQALRPPSWAHWFGTDHLGRDIFSRVLVATRLDVSIALAAVSLSLVVGCAAGACAGFYGGWTERLISRMVDTIMAFPLFVLAMGIVAALGNTVANIVYATAIINLPFYARVARSEVNVRRSAGFVEGGTALWQQRSTAPGGASHPQYSAAHDGAGIAQYGLGYPQPLACRSLAWECAPRLRSGASWWPRGPRSLCQASGGWLCSPAPF